MRGAIHRTLDAESASEFLHLRNIVRTRGQHRIAKTQVHGDLHALWQYIDADDVVGAELAAESARCQAHRPQSSNEHGVIAVDADLLQPLVDRAKSAGHLRAVSISELIGKRYQVLLLGDHVFSHAAVAL